MSDLIRKSDVLDLLYGIFDKYKMSTDKNTSIGKSFGTDVFEEIRNMPTAYDIGNVVEKLKMNKQNALEVEESIKEYNVWNKAIEIVKQGGFETEIETIRDKAIKWNNNSSKRVPYEFIAYVEGKRDIGVSDDVCEWKSASDGEFIQNPHTKRLYSNEPSMKNVYCNTCGKKIKVVE